MSLNPDEKPDLRRHFRALRAAIPTAKRTAAAQALADRVLTELTDPTTPTTPVFLYLATPHELDTRPLIQRLLARQTPVLLPRIEADQLIPTPLTTLNQLEPGPHNTLQPPPATYNLQPTTYNLLIPALAVTPAGDRLGQGGGYYDRYLTQHPNTQTTALVYDTQITDHLPTEPHDRRVQRIITPTRTIHCTT
ncbi:MAG: 5-formyltetrahydrofolate cyclo-ligase [Planctomycetota bacterium]